MLTNEAQYGPTTRLSMILSTTVGPNPKVRGTLAFSLLSLVLLISTGFYSAMSFSGVADMDLYACGTLTCVCSSSALQRRMGLCSHYQVLGLAMCVRSSSMIPLATCNSYSDPSDDPKQANILGEFLHNINSHHTKFHHLPYLAVFFSV